MTSYALSQYMEYMSLPEAPAQIINIAFKIVP